MRHHSATTLLKSEMSVGEFADRHGWRTVEMVNRYRHFARGSGLRHGQSIGERVAGEPLAGQSS